MNVLVVGGAGYVGGAVTSLLNDTDNNIRVYDNLLYEETYRKPIDFIYGDVRDHEKLLTQLNWADTVIWLAALVGDGACQINSQLAKEINTDSIGFLAENFNGRIIFPSTCSVYGAQDAVLDEVSGASPLSVYAQTKLDAEKLLDSSNAIIFRLGTLFGVGDLFSRIRLDLVVNTLTVKAFVDGKISVFGGDQFRPLLHVSDVAGEMVKNINTTHTGIFNLHRQNVRIRDLAYQIRNHYPNVVIKETDLPFQDTRNYRVSSEKAVSNLGFTPKYSIDYGIDQLKELIETRRIKNTNSDRYSNYNFLKTNGVA